MHLSHSSQVSEIVAVIWEIASKYFLRTTGNERKYSEDQLCVKRRTNVTWYNWMEEWRRDSWFFLRREDPRTNRLFSKLFYFMVKNPRRNERCPGYWFLGRRTNSEPNADVRKWEKTIWDTIVHKHWTRDKQLLFQDSVNGLIDTAHSAGLDKLGGKLREGKE